MYRKDILILVLMALLAPTASARDSHVGAGSAIVPAYTTRAEEVAPGGEVRILTCVTNDNPHALRDIERGDSFTLAFGGGDVLGCDGLDVHSPDGGFLDGSFICSVDGPQVTITRTGVTTRWLPGDQVCAVLRYLAPDKSVSVRCSYDVSNEGAYAPPMPHYLVLGVGDELGSRGPEGAVGPPGPTGPAGPAGPAAAGARSMWTSTGSVAAVGLQPPVTIPGLEGNVVVGSGSSLLITIDAMSYGCVESLGDTHFNPQLLLLLDDTVVARRDIAVENPLVTVNPSLFKHPLNISWLSPPLVAGSHAISVKLQNTTDDFTNRTLCVGSAVDDGKQARLLAIELRP